MDTIFALASAPGKAGVAVTRLSGPLAFKAGTSLTGKLPPPRTVALRHVVGPGGKRIDQSLVLTFEAAHSFTGELVVEFHTHGGPATVAALHGALGGLSGVRLAEPGEFTRRAFENGRLDLAQVEGLGDLIEAETEAQRNLALRVFDGALGEKVAKWRGDLVRAVALLEATIDFVDEDVPIDVGPEVMSLMDGVRSDLEKEIAGSRVSERIHDGFEVAIVGPPNAGKSSLLNLLAGRDAAITAEGAGTTRDVIEVRMNIAGFAVTLLDTAGLREAEDAVELIGIDRARARAARADVRVFLGDGTDHAVLGVPLGDDDILAEGKSDTRQIASGRKISVVTGEGVDDLVMRLAEIFEERAAGAATANRQRHRAAMANAIINLESARAYVATATVQTELAADHLRSGCNALDVLIGRVDVENVLDEIFSRFCLGK